MDYIEEIEAWVHEELGGQPVEHWLGSPEGDWDDIIPK